jgi:hypothetical protein
MHWLILPFLIAAVAWRRHDPLLGFGVLWTFATLIPTAWLTVYYMDRFFYMPAIGTSLITARAVQCLWRFTASRTGVGRSLRLTAPVGLAYLAAANLAAVTLLCLSSRDDSRRLAAVFQCLQQNAHSLPHGSLVVLKNVPERYIGSGLGVAEMVRLGLGDATAEGLLEHQELSSWWLTRMNQHHSVYVLDFAQHPLALRAVTPGRRLADRPSPGEESRAAPTR